MTHFQDEQADQDNSGVEFPNFRLEIADLSPVLLGELNEKLRRASDDEPKVLGEKIPAGKRNSTLASLAGTMRRRGMSQEAIEAALLEENKRCDPPLAEAEVRSIAQSVSRYSPAKKPNVNTPRWPEPLRPEAFQGLAGLVVRMISPHSEADEAALLIQTLVAFGNAVGHIPYFRTEADRHYSILFCTLVGRTSKGRKGTSWKHIRRLFEAVDQDWADNRVKGGLSSGEGLVVAVRDPLILKGKVVDDGETDKRLLVMEAELASVLQVIQRQGNTLSAVIRQAWDSEVLNILTKNSPATATGAHISIISHITIDELKRQLGETEKANGFANRFLWILVRRSKLLPEGGQVPEADFAHLVRDLAASVAFARQVQEMTRTESARELWRNIYGELSEGEPGLFGAITSRSEAQVVRLSCLYALLDRSQFVDRGHLEAALAVWKYSEDSVRYIFGDAIGDPLADQLLQELRRMAPLGMTRTEISTFFGRHKGAEEIGRILITLAERGLARAREEKGEGRPVERWFATSERSEISEESTLGAVISHTSPISHLDSPSVGDTSRNSLISLPEGRSLGGEEEM